MKSPLPKLAKDLAALVGIARKETSPARIEAALVDARGQIDAATHDREMAEAAYRDGLLDASEADLAKRLAEKEQATIRLDRAQALHAALTIRLRDAREAEAHAARKAHWDAAQAQAAAIGATFAERYVRHATGLRDCLAELAAAEIAAGVANREAGEFGFIPAVEDTIRSGHAVPEEILSTEEVELWVIDGRTEPAPDERQGDVRPDPHNPSAGRLASVQSGSLPTSAAPWPCHKRRFLKTVFREALAGSHADSLLRAVHLPRLHHLGVPFIEAERFRDHDAALAHLTAPRPADPVIRPATRERLELIPDPPAEQEQVVPFAKREPAPPPRVPSAREIRATHTPTRLMGA